MCNSEHAWDQLKKKKKFYIWTENIGSNALYIKWHFKLASKNKVVYMEMHIDLYQYCWLNIGYKNIENI